MDRHKDNGHWPSAGQKEETALCDVASEFVAHRILTHIGPIVANTHCDGCG